MAQASTERVGGKCRGGGQATPRGGEVESGGARRRPWYGGTTTGDRNPFVVGGDHGLGRGRKDRDRKA